MVAGTLYLLLFVGCFALTGLTSFLAWILYRVGKRREARAAALRASRRGEEAGEQPLVSAIPLGVDAGAKAPSEGEGR